MEHTIDAICYTIIAVCFIIAIKNCVTYKMHSKIGAAIFQYNMFHITSRDFEKYRLVDYTDMESYEATLFRIWDWGYKRILPPEKFELIKPFIK